MYPFPAFIMWKSPKRYGVSVDASSGRFALAKFHLFMCDVMFSTHNGAQVARNNGRIVCCQNAFNIGVKSHCICVFTYTFICNIKI